jgi:hypothetical protein
MPARTRTPFGALALAALVAGTVALAQPPTADPPKKIDPPPSAPPKDPAPQAVKLPDGTFLWLGTGPDGERVTLSPQEYQKLVERAEALKKELAARKPVAPSSCAIKARVEKRGDQLVAALKLTYSFRTSHPNAAVALGGREAFLVSAALDGAKLPVLEAGDDGFAVAIETAGEHTLVLDAEAPVLGRAKGEVGFELGLPRAPITALALEQPPGDVKRVALATRTEAGAKGADGRRTAVLDAEQLAAREGVPLGPVELLDVSWEPPAGGAPATDAVLSAEFDISATLTEAFADTVAKVKLRGPAREWRLIAPPGTTEVTPERAAAGEVGPTLLPTVTKPSDAAKNGWKIELPPGSPASDWVFTVTVRHPRAKGAKGGAPIGPFAVANVLKQSGTVRVTGPSWTRFALKHGPELRRTEAPAPDTDDAPVAHFRFATGPTGAAPPGAPLLTADAVPVEGSVRVSPAYKLQLTEAGWSVRAEIAVRPVRAEIAELTFELPPAWRGFVPDLDREPLARAEEAKGKSGEWRPVVLTFAAPQRKPFTVALSATVPVPPGARAFAVPLLRFPQLIERDATALVAVGDGTVVSGTARGWDGDAPAAFGEPLVPVPGPDGKVPKAVARASARAARGLARLALEWEPFRPDLSAELRADVTVGERQLVVTQTLRLKSPDGFPKPVKLRGPAGALGLKPALESPAAGVWLFAPPPDARDATLRVTFALPLPAQPDGPLSVPAGLLWPADAAQAEATVRVWSVAGRALGAPPAGWRELPPEPAPEREALPALALAASGEQALALELRPAAPDPAAGAWVDRALIEAAPTDDGGTAYRARFRLARWLVSALEFDLPDGATAVSARADGAAAPLVPAGPLRYRVALPESTGRALALEVQYAVPGARAAVGETAYRPPVLAGATFGGPVRWFVTEPASAAPLVLRPNGRAELRWRARGATYAPAAPTAAALNNWFEQGTEPPPTDAGGGPEGEAVLVRQSEPAELRVARVPWLALVAGASALALLTAVLLARLPGAAAGAAVALLGGAFAVLAVLFPHPAAQALAAAQPGAALGLALALALAALRRRARLRVERLPGFSRVPAEPTGSAPVSAPPSASSAPRGSSQVTAPSGA